jgi:hypothetical protein
MIETYLMMESRVAGRYRTPCLVSLVLVPSRKRKIVNQIGERAYDAGVRPSRSRHAPVETFET